MRGIVLFIRSLPGNTFANPIPFADLMSSGVGGVTSETSGSFLSSGSTGNFTLPRSEILSFWSLYGTSTSSASNG